MIDSTNCRRSLKNRLIKDLKDRYKYIFGAIANPSKKTIDFLTVHTWQVPPLIQYSRDKHKSMHYNSGRNIRHALLLTI